MSVGGKLTKASAQTCISRVVATINTSVVSPKKGGVRNKIKLNSGAKVSFEFEVAQLCAPRPHRDLLRLAALPRPDRPRCSTIEHHRTAIRWYVRPQPIAITGFLKDRMHLFLRIAS